MNLKETKWRSGKPDYTLANHVFLKGKTQNHKRGKNNTFPSPPKKAKSNLILFFPGSLERIVENLVKTWEMEASHKVDLGQWVTVCRDADKYQESDSKIQLLFCHPGCSAFAYTIPFRDP